MNQVRRGTQIGTLAAASATRDAGTQDLPAADKASSLIYVDHCALTRDCIGSQLALALPEHRLAVLASPSDAWRVNQPCCIIYHTHALSTEDAAVLRDLGLLQNVTTGVPMV